MKKKLKSPEIPETFHTYKEVRKLERGDCVVNLGIVAAVFFNPSQKLVKLTFNPSREPLNRKSGYYYSFDDKLMTA